MCADIKGEINRIIDTKIQGLKSEFMNICSDLESRIATVEQQLTELGETRPSVVENPLKDTEKCVIARGVYYEPHSNSLRKFTNMKREKSYRYIYRYENGWVSELTRIQGEPSYSMTNISTAYLHMLIHACTPIIYHPLRPEHSSWGTVSACNISHVILFMSCLRLHERDESTGVCYQSNCRVFLSFPR